MPKLLSDEEREPLLRKVGKAAAAFWRLESDQEGYQACKEYNESMRRAGRDGELVEWLVGAGCRAGGVSGAERDELAQIAVFLHQRRAG